MIYFHHPFSMAKFRPTSYVIQDPSNSDNHNNNNNNHHDDDDDDGNNKHSVKCPYSEVFWSVFFRIRTEYGPE